MLMINRPKSIVLPLCGALIVTLTAGCEDESARQRANVQASLESATQSFRQASFAPPEEAESSFNAVVRELSPISDGAPSQLAAKSLLMADSLRELARMNLRQASQQEIQLRRQRQRAITNFAGMLRLRAQAGAMGSTSTEAQREAFMRERAQVEMGLAELRSRIAALDSPINELVSQNKADAEEVARLRDEANALHRHATDLGAAGGFPTFEEAVALRREADKVEYRMARRDIELSLELEPERDFTQLQMQSANALLESVDAMLRELEQFDQTYQTAATALATAAGSLRTQVAEAVQEIEGALADDLEPLYEQAVANLERAATQARQAAGQLRQDGAAARLTEVRCHELLTRAHIGRARGLESHLQMLASLAQDDEQRDVQSRITAVAAQQRQLVEAARQSLEAAQSALEQVTGRIEGLEAFRTLLRELGAALSGEAPPDLPQMPDIPDMPDMPDVPDLPDGLNFDPATLEGMNETVGPEVLLAMLDQMDIDTLAKQMPPGMGFDDPQMLEMLRGPFGEAKKAVQARVEAGDITTMGQLMEVFQQELMQKLMGG